VGLSPSLVMSIPNPLIGHKNLLGNLHKDNKGIPCKKKKEKQKEED